MAAKEIVLVPLVSIGVFRNGANLIAPIGKAFSFYEEEVADIRKAEKAEDKDMVREPVKEEAKAATPAAKVTTDDI